MKIKLLITVLIIVALGVAGYAVYINWDKNTNQNNNVAITNTVIAPDSIAVAKFTSASEFKQYLQSAKSVTSDFGFSATTLQRDFAVEDIGSTVGLGASEITATPDVDRVSDTNVQVVGIDEPDIVKTDGNNLYISQEGRYYGTSFEISPLRLTEDVLPPPDLAKTSVVKSFPVDAMAVSSTINESGEMLLSNNSLVILGSGSIYGYNVSEPTSPSKTWTIDLKDADSVSSARLYNDKLYLVTQSRINISDPCPFEPLTLDLSVIEVPCADIYHPTTPLQTDTTFTIFEVNPADGLITNKVSFTGSAQQSVIYMSKQAIYVTYTTTTSVDDFYLDFILNDGRKMFPTSIINKLEKLDGYDISQQAKSIELFSIIQQYQESLADTEADKFEEDMTTLMEAYVKKRQRQLETTGISKIPINQFTVTATGVVPGRLLNQFALDEYNGILRVATTSGETFGSDQSVNDVYTLDGNLDILGSVLDLGLGERIYSVRFVGDRGYVVTFRQIDPFYILDLSQPAKPAMTGELKIPGFSSYLDPLTDNLILGVGEEDNQVKISLFDVSDPTNPVEKSKYQLKEYWSEVSSNHHAFLHDAEYQVFFIPAGSKGFVFTYANNEVLPIKSVTNIEAKRAVYVNNYLYIIGADKIVVLDEETWEEVKSLEL
ncbi:beta-propeller domain-containing protein [Patescibacteria group bacterium]